MILEIFLELKKSLESYSRQVFNFDTHQSLSACLQYNEIAVCVLSCFGHYSVSDGDFLSKLRNITHLILYESFHCI